MASLSNLLCTLIVVGIVITTAESGVILDGWFHTANGYKYKTHFKATSWHNARHYCQRMGGDLAVHMMKDYGTRVAVSNIMLTDGYFWIGLSDEVHEGRWRWVDGSYVSSSNGHWASGEPNNYKGREDCGGISADIRFKANDVPCNDNNMALCEKRI